jgi:hypothetical protein
MLTDADIEKMQVLYKTHFGIELDKDEARTKLSLLVRQMELVYVPITAQQLKAYRDEVRKVNGENENESKAGKVSSRK